MVAFVVALCLALKEPGRRSGWFSSFRLSWRECRPWAKEVSSLLKRNAKLLKGYRMAWFYMILIPLGVLGMRTAEYGLNNTADGLGPALAYIYVTSGGSPWAFWSNTIIALVTYWMYRMMAGGGAVMALMGAVFSYKTLLKEANYRLPWFSFALSCASALFGWHITRWIVGLIRHGSTAKWISDYDLIARFTVPLMGLYLSGVSAFFAVVFLVVRARLVIGFARNGDNYRRSEYYRMTVGHTVEALPSFRETAIAAIREKLHRPDSSPEDAEHDQPTFSVKSEVGFFKSLLFPPKDTHISPGLRARRTPRKTRHSTRTARRSKHR